MFRVYGIGCRLKVLGLEVRVAGCRSPPTHMMAAPRRCNCARDFGYIPKLLFKGLGFRVYKAYGLRFRVYSLGQARRLKCDLGLEVREYGTESPLPKPIQ